MRLAPPPLKIGELDGFAKSDIFDAKVTGERLANVIGNLEGHSVIALDGEWGTGKSVFVQQLAGLLRNRKHLVVYFDAFAHDYLNEAFFPLLSALLNATNSGHESLITAKDKLIAKVEPLLRTVPTLAVDAAVRTLTVGMFKSQDIRSAVKRNAATANPAQEMMEQRLAKLKGLEACVAEFKSAISIAIQDCGSRGARLPLVFIVDELDRCRPRYALSVVEQLKHVFSADGMCTILVTHLDELAAMVSREYGVVNPRVYLEKFYHIRLDFSKVLLRGSEEVRKRYLNHLRSVFGISHGPDHIATLAIDNLTRLYNVSLRGQEQIILTYALVRAALMSTWEFDDFRKNFAGYILSTLVVMRFVAPEIYREVPNSVLRWSDVSGFLKMDSWFDSDEAVRETIEEIWKCVTVEGKKLSVSDLIDSSSQFARPALIRDLFGEFCAALDQLLVGQNHDS